MWLNLQNSQWQLSWVFPKVLMKSLKPCLSSNGVSVVTALQHPSIKERSWDLVLFPVPLSVCRQGSWCYGVVTWVGWTYEKHSLWAWFELEIHVNQQCVWFNSPSRGQMKSFSAFKYRHIRCFCSLDTICISLKSPMFVLQPEFSGEVTDSSWNTYIDFLPYHEWTDWRSELNCDIMWNCINLTCTHLP